MNPGAHFGTSMVRPLVILVTSVKIKIGQGSYKSGIFVGKPFVGPFLIIFFILVIET